MPSSWAYRKFSVAFISYSRRDLEFARTLEQRFGALQIDCWLDEHDMRAGRITDQIVEAMRKHQPVVLVLSGAAFESDWVEAEAALARQLEKELGREVLFPLVTDLTPDEACVRMQSNWEMALAHQIGGRHIVDFRDWRQNGRFDAAFEKLLRAVSTAPAAKPAMSPLLRDYLEREANRYSFVKLPLPDEQGNPLYVPTDTIRIELPLRYVYRHPRHASSPVVVPRTYLSSELHAGSVRSPAEDRAWCLDELLDATPRLVVLGAPGAGKTTLLSFVAHAHAVGALQEQPSSSRVAVILFCDLMAGSVGDDLGALIRQQLLKQGYGQRSQRLAGLLHEMLESGRALLLVDGLDEISDKERQRMAALLANQAITSPAMPIVMSSRVVGFDGVAEMLSVSFDRLRIAPLGIAEKEEYITAAAKWSARLFPQNEPALLQDIVMPQVRDGRQIARLCDSVLFLSLYVQMFLMGNSLSKDGKDVYRRTIEFMVRRQRRNSSPPFDMNELLPCLEYLAYRMRSDGKQHWPKEQVTGALEDLYARDARARAFRRRDVRRWLDDVLQKLEIMNVAGVGRDTAGYEQTLVQFFHPSFQEYFAAQALIHDHGNADGSGVIEKLRALIRDFAIEERQVEGAGEPAYALT